MGPRPEEDPVRVPRALAAEARDASGGRPASAVCVVLVDGTISIS